MSKKYICTSIFLYILFIYLFALYLFVRLFVVYLFETNVANAANTDTLLTH